MATFQWQGVSARGEVLTGEMEAPTRDAVLVRLRSQRILPFQRKSERGEEGSAERSRFPASENRSDRGTSSFLPDSWRR